MIKPYWSFLLILFSHAAIGQDSTFINLPNPPSPEIYDLLKDSRGYIWLGHDLGVSRYDGHHFVSFTNPQQNALSMTDLCEDGQGRVWCHNFESQVFYIDNFKLNLLKDYRFEDEPRFPRMGICGDELVATSAKGLFAFNTKTFTGKYYLFPNGCSSLAVLNNKVLLYGNRHWYLYRPEIGISAVEINDLAIENESGITLQPKGLMDTAFFTTNPDGFYFKVFLKGNRLYLLKKRNANGFINAITIDHTDVWVHTRSYSFKEETTDSILHSNLTDVIKDNSGNIFISSLKNGLSVKYNPYNIEPVKPFSSDKEDFIRKIIADGDHFVCGTQKGEILLLSKDFGKLAALSIPGKDIPIEQLYKISQGQFIAGTTIGMFLINFNNQEIALIDKTIILKDFAMDGDDIYLATTKGLLQVSLNRLIHYDSKKTPLLPYTIRKTGRTKAIALYAKNGHRHLLCSFNDGVYELDDHQNQPLLYNGHRIYTTTIKVLNNKVFLGTFNQGIFIIDNGKMTNITTRDSLLSNSIKSIKISPGNELWIIYFTGSVQKMDTGLHLVPSTEIPFKGAMIYDIEEDQQKIYLTTNYTLYKIEPYRNQSVSTASYIDYILINGKDSTVHSGIFAHNQNNLQINLSTPFFNRFYSPRYKYRFYDVKNADSGWQVTNDDQRVFNLAGLQPGNYLFEAVPVNPVGQPIARGIRQVMEVVPAWYQTVLFKVALMVIFGLLVFFIVRFFFLYSHRKKQALLERQIAVYNERQRISSDLHDDIGSTISSINIYAGLAKKADNKEFYLDSISQNVNEVVGKLDDLVWSINPRYETLGDIAERLKAYADPLIRAKEMRIAVQVEESIKEMKPPSPIKHHLYLVAKECINNAIKHSGCTEISIRFEGKPHKLVLVISDDGKGFDTTLTRTERNGVRNINQRVQEMNGAIDIRSSETSGTMITLEIPL